MSVFRDDQLKRVFAAVEKAAADMADGDAPLDVEVIDRDMLAPEMQALHPKPWLVVYPNAYTVWVDTEEEACALHVAHRQACGLDETTGEKVGASGLAAAVQAMKQFLESSQDLVLATHWHRFGETQYVFLRQPGVVFTEDDFAKMLGDSYEQNREDELLSVGVLEDPAIIDEAMLKELGDVKVC